MGFEVLPQSDVPADFSTLATFVQPPAINGAAPPSAPTNLRIMGAALSHLYEMLFPRAAVAASHTHVPGGDRSPAAAAHRH
jgi:hypothetical protein